MRHSCFLCGLPDPTRDFVNDYIVVRRVSAQQATEADDGVVLLCLSEGARGRGNFESARGANDTDVVFFCAGTNQAVVSAAQQPLSNELIKSGDDDSETQTTRVQFSSDAFVANCFFSRSC